MNFEEASAEAREAIASDDAELVYIDTLSITHPALSDAIHAACAYESFVADGIRYQAFPFTLSFPALEEKASSVMQITLHDNDGTVFQAAQQVARTNKPVEIVWRQYVERDGDFSLVSRFRVPMDATNVSRQKQRTEKGIVKVVTISCSHVDFVNRTIGHKKYTAAEFQGLRQ